MNCVEALKALRDGKRVADNHGVEVRYSSGGTMYYNTGFKSELHLNERYMEDDAFRMIEPEPQPEPEPPKIEGFDLCEVKTNDEGWLGFTRAKNALGLLIGLNDAVDFADFAGYVYRLPNGEYSPITCTPVMHSEDIVFGNCVNKLILRPAFVAFKKGSLWHRQ